MSTVTGIAGVRVAILVTVDVFRLSDGVRNSKMSTVTGIAIRVTVDVFRFSDDVLNSKMSTVTGIAEGRVAMLVIDVFRLPDNVPIVVTVHAFGLSHLLGNLKVSTPHLQNI